VNASFQKHILDFRIPARTSRGAYEKKEVFILTLSQQGITGKGEASPLPGLSIDNISMMEVQLKSLCDFIQEKQSLKDIREFPADDFPSIRFALESAMANLEHGGDILFPSAFTRGMSSIPVNGLVWMNEAEKMWEQAEQKIADGFSCIKLKIGALDFDDECRLLERIRKKYSAFKVELRVDANGAFHADDAMHALKELYRFELHSIEQPIKPKQYDMMQKLCAESRLPIALDEELIGMPCDESTRKIMHSIHPAYFILKPTLLGGFTASDWWIKTGADANIGFWITSALESNIGLNALAQYCGKLNVDTPQGLGTGALYTTNFDSRLEIRNGLMKFNAI
jgi:o-succinylbenzoate synthase